MTALEALKKQQPAARPASAVPVVQPLPDRRGARWWQLLATAGGLLAMLPVSLVIAIAIKLTSRGPVLYRGTRVGLGLKPFTIFKFRTLEVDAEQKIGARLLTSGDQLHTPIGRFLKRYKLDEIPQLWNVLRGDMNLTGPRPVRPIFLATSTRDIPNYTARFRVRPGMTGLAQLRGGYFTHPRDKLRYDLLYVRHRGLLLDVKLVLATFVKLLNRWLTLGVLLALIFLCASFVPAVFTAPFEINVGGFQLSPFEAFGLLLAGVVLVRQIPAHRLYLYRTPTNLPMGAFVVFVLFAGILADDMGARLSDVAYFTASGFLIVFLIVSGEITEAFATKATRVVALAAVAVSSVGLLEVVAQTQVAVGVVGVHGADGMRRITGTLGNPVALSAYLLLGMPLVLAELACSERREEHDFWLISTTLVIVGVLLTQTRTGLLALLVTGSLFCWRVSRRTFAIFASATLLFVVAMVLTGGLRLSPASVHAEFVRRLAVTRSVVGTDMSPVDLLVGAEPGKGPVSVVDVATPGGHRRAQNANMHLTLMLRVGVIGWGLMMWVIGAALLAIYRGSRAVRDRRLGLLLWAILSAGIGFLVSMSNFNAFYNPTTQIMFWGLLGIGVAIVTHHRGGRPAFNVIWRFGAGD